MRKVIFLSLAFICLVTAIGFAGSSDNGNGSDLYPLLSGVFVLLFGLFSVLSGAIVLQQHCVYFKSLREAVAFLRSVGYKGKDIYEIRNPYFIHEGWIVYIVTEQVALMHKNDTRFLNHVLVNLGLKNE
jgi:hypothetical protein